MAQGKQGKKGAAAKAAAAGERRRTGRRRLALIVLALFVIGSLVVAGVAMGLGHPSVDEGEVVVVEDAPDGTITQEDFDAALEQTAARQGVGNVPAPDDPQYDLLKDAAVSDLILARWVAGEAEDRGIEVAESDVDRELESVINQQFGSQAAFDRFLEQSGFTPEQARERIELQLISDRIQQEVLPEEPAISEEEIETYYEENLTQFEQPETRDVRVITTETEEEASEVRAELEQDASAKAFEQLARRFSIDEATKTTGGLRQGVVEGQSEPALEEQIFAAPLDELVGPFETDAGFSVIKVEDITEGTTTALADATDQVRQTLVAARQQQIADAFQQDFEATWRSRTFCAEDFLTDRCANSEPAPDPCTEEVAETQGCGAPVPSTRPVAPGTAGVFGSPAPIGLPQGPVTPQADQAPGGLPPGLEQLGPGGTTVPPGGAAPPPSGAVPPGGAAPPPSGAVPPG